MMIPLQPPGPTSVSARSRLAKRCFASGCARPARTLALRARLAALARARPLLRSCGSLEFLPRRLLARPLHGLIQVDDRDAAGRFHGRGRGTASPLLAVRSPVFSGAACGARTLVHPDRLSGHQRFWVLQSRIQLVAYFATHSRCQRIPMFFEKGFDPVWLPGHQLP